jgi:hypothetical protein
VQSPDAVAKMSACCGDHTAAYTQYACSAKVRMDPGGPFSVHSFTVSSHDQGLTLVHFSAQLEQLQDTFMS